MQCRNHPDREAAAVCQKHAVGFCRECCDCSGDCSAECVDPKNYCKFRTQCIIREISRERRKGKTLIAACNPDEPVYPE